MKDTAIPDEVLVSLITPETAALVDEVAQEAFVPRTPHEWG